VHEARLAFCFGVHNHQPVGNFDQVVDEATARAYDPFLKALAARPEVRLTIHWTGSLLEWLRERAPATFDLLGTLAARGQVELLGGGFYEPILAILPDHDKVGQIERLSDFLKSHFGVRPRGMWLAERVWEPHLPRALRQAGVDYVLVDDSHFAQAGLDPDVIGGYYLTDDQGASVAVFPISQRLRYLIPFSDVEATLEYLETRRGQVPALTMVDDGEKFGVWPGTHRLVYEQGWLDRFFDRLQATPWLQLRTFSELLDTVAPAGRVYLPTASYREMGEWALPLAAARQIDRARHELDTLPEGRRFAALLRGGFWRVFLVKYPEVADIYWKMLRLSQAIARQAERGSDGRLDAARLALWRGQANDAYWHGVFGGCYLPHLRRAVKQALLEAERTLDEVTGRPAIDWERGDLDGDGRQEIVVRTPALVITVRPEEGGMLTELGFLPRGHDAADVLARRPELYHDQVGRQRADADETVQTIHATPVSKEAGLAERLQYDSLRRGSLIDGLFAADVVPDAVAPWAAARVVLGGRAFRSALEATPDALTIRLTGGDAGLGLTVDKRLLIRDDRVTARYRIRGPSSGPVRWAVQWNLALTAGEGGRYLTLDGQPPLRSRGRQADLGGVTLVDEWARLAAELTWSPAAELAWGPVETVSVSESGFERIYQGTALLVSWTVPDLSTNEEDMTITLTLTLGAR
jgi:alpha-amylase